ncbi:MAG TPA: alternative ribosome rescue aminoacyl-tRNA hydrolase ArfB [Gemmatimonadales bacterium]
MTLPASGGAPTPESALAVNATVSIPRTELEVRATRSGGPGGQHVNTSSTRIEIRWNVLRSSALDEEQRARVVARLAARVDGEGWLRVVSSESRSQRQNREAAEARLAEMVRRALVIPRTRKPTKPSRAAKRARLEDKRKQGEKKARRRWKSEE